MCNNLFKNIFFSFYLPYFIGCNKKFQLRIDHQMLAAYKQYFANSFIF
jgi:hypothetical protein